MEATLTPQGWRARMFGVLRAQTQTGAAADQRWWGLPLPARLYVAAVIGSGTVAIAQSLPTTYPSPALFAVLLVAACLMSAWKIPMPVAVTSSCTLSVADAANIMSLLLLGADAAAIIAV